jgi:hypothetical protein
MSRDVINRLLEQEMRWVEIGWNHYAYCTASGEIKADIISAGTEGLWRYNAKKYIDKESAKKAVERDFKSPHPSQDKSDQRIAP